MTTILIQPKSKKELDFITEFLKRTDIKNRIITDDERESNVLGSMIEQGMKTKSVTKETILKHLSK